MGREQATQASSTTSRTSRSIDILVVLMPWKLTMQSMLLMMRMMMMMVVMIIMMVVVVVAVVATGDSRGHGERWKMVMKFHDCKSISTTMRLKMAMMKEAMTRQRSLEEKRCEPHQGASSPIDSSRCPGSVSRPAGERKKTVWRGLNMILCGFACIHATYGRTPTD